MWPTLKQCLLTNAENATRGVGSDNACEVCGHGSEDVLHVLRDCPAARDIWDKLIPIDKLSRFYSGPIYECIWKNRNIFIFQGISLNIDEIIKVSYSWAKRYASISKSPSYKTQSLVATSHLERNWVCLTINGSIRIEDGFAVAGGFVCDHNRGGFSILVDIWAHAQL
ncbi:hypothetical protein Golob_020025 [Gossypium lobatum]|uniref:Reverse transcriptase zinc-binding domain-containing protein n=1 Tax=Gossypium lobatum TaxID=34289 RepID=A0A7J8L955_9ROSI|nr:hypothetical protein [Gossypium lobatum]